METTKRKLPCVKLAQCAGRLITSMNYHLRNRTCGMKHDNQLYTETIFREMLVSERKRTERTKRPFLLVKIKLDRVDDRLRAEAADALGRNITGAIRETDILGWLVGGSEIGVVLNDITAGSEEVLVQKISAQVDASLSTVCREKVEVASVLFPQATFRNTDSEVTFNSLVYRQCAYGDIAAQIPVMIKRGIDIVGSIAGILIFLPFFIILPIILKVTSKGPVFFIQQRIGRYGKPFTCIKFRTMKQKNDPSQHKEFMKKFISGTVVTEGKGNDTVYKMKDDPRVTGIGKFLRKTSLDELPQFINVLLGHMSIVGPRPAISYEVEAYDLWHRRRVFAIKPGITGIWQIKGRSRTDFNSMVRMDIQYINTWSPILDLQVIATTPIAMVSAKGAV